ncbi:PREDICTED: S-locus-specific glycoprotein S13-like [Camelina sativa]|uniref:S-locus-specific glycoprotein S13-like n=1 Tax=Camelina sativa TaxID=90675 RepID=A0ABM1QBW4_CAMSA|nr:PREDICTED: S-locus-specific glycoprotein S13-like [Camelina sativa]
MSIRHTLTGLVLYLLFQIASSSSHASNTLLPSESLRLSSNSTLASPGDVFELGFFSSGNRWYIGIWYKKVSVRTYVWVANRDNPLLDSNGTFGISATNLVIRDQVNRLIWSTELRIQRSLVAAELLDNGNFVLRSNDLDEDEFLWQSFHFPTDTLIPQMQLGLDPKRFLTSWKIKDDDPSSGDYTFRFQTQVSPELFGSY